VSLVGTARYYKFTTAGVGTTFLLGRIRRNQQLLHGQLSRHMPGSTAICGFARMLVNSSFAPNTDRDLIARSSCGAAAPLGLMTSRL